jgi:hypothetical protein
MSKIYDATNRGTVDVKWRVAGIRSFAKFPGQMPLIATTGITSWQTALKWMADCQSPRSGCQEYMRLGHTCGNPRDGYFILGNPRSKRRGMPQSAAHI